VIEELGDIGASVTTSVSPAQFVAPAKKLQQGAVLPLA
jgi:hypothetical protein